MKSCEPDCKSDFLLYYSRDLYVNTSVYILTGLADLTPRKPITWPRMTETYMMVYGIVK